MHCSIPDPALRWDIFCQVIDNFGDIGVCWRLACNLAQRGQIVRLWVDDASALAWMAPDGAPRVEVRAWTTPLDLAGIVPGDVMIEAFGCRIAPEFIAIYASNIRARGQKSIWINLEYLSAEDFSARCHGLPSPVMFGPGEGLAKHFFYPGFTKDTGGLLREPNLLVSRAQFDRDAWLAGLGVEWRGERLVSLFCYEPAGLGDLLDTLAHDTQPTRLLVTHGRASEAVREEISRKMSLKPLWSKREKLLISYLPQLTQTEFDHLLWACDLNFVRGEDSLVRALWAGKPFVWQIYPQDDGAHGPKLDAFLTWLQAPPSLRRAHDIWNGLNTSAAADPQRPWLTPQNLADWQAAVELARQTLLGQDDLAQALITFALKTN
ncbi:MAG: elongation factor P maturation arginine rhamnosyltransferase EarP [Rhodoferax sp.]|uniref:elongation factor P maturation arginine rhamnosyltransferase EarP n=1 Tax=Rhodoferax sp. TaxID=50421 RepID=UPI0026242B78|nr:elongation factor P maturation arginine rhamnosyltransferase EarP [Rhodoferax sp.]MDD2879225.1 elongation factor P maturation arginine rhamnosyltransferase EarP [Rhodoferax sp.]